MRFTLRFGDGYEILMSSWVPSPPLREGERVRVGSKHLLRDWGFVAELSVFAFMGSGAFLAGTGVESLSIIIMHEGKRLYLLMRHAIRETSQLPPSKRTLKWFLLRRPL